jgi:hypothetical protein
MQLSLKRGDEVGTNQASKSLRPTDCGNLRDDASHTSVDCGVDKHMSATVALPPHADALRVRLIEALSGGDSIGAVPDLLPRITFLSRRTVARAKIAIVVYDRR